MKLQDALRKVIRRYGMSIIEDKRVMAFLADYKAFDEFPAVKPVMKAIAEGGYGRELCRLAADESDAEYLRYAAGLKNTLAADKNFRKEFADYAVDSISLALGLVSSAAEPLDHGFDPENHGNTGKEDTRKAQNSPSGTGSSSQEDGNESPDDVVFQKVRELIAEYAPGLRPEDIKPDDSLKELCHKGRSASVVIGLGYDEPSILLLDLGKKLGITFPSLWAQIAGNARIATVRDAVEYIKSHQPRQPGSGCTDS